MNDEIKYIYFEINYVKGIGEINPTIENENVLLIKPKTNSNGVWSFTNITERKGLSHPTFSIVEQYWIDLEKFKKVQHKVYNSLKKQVDMVLEKVNQKIEN